MGQSDICLKEIMNRVCGLCHWPYVYRDQDTMWAEKCDYCPAAAAVKLALQSLVKEEPHG